MSRTVGITHCIDHDRIDIAGIWSLLKYECMTCNKHERRLNGTECDDCYLIFNSSYNYKKDSDDPGRRRVGCGAKFKQFGLNQNYSHVGKHQLYFFLFHPELNFILPEFPPLDMFGNLEPLNEKNKPTWCWHIHHLNGLFYDDRKDNLVLCLNTEHKFIDEYIKIWRWNY